MPWFGLVLRELDMLCTLIFIQKALSVTKIYIYYLLLHSTVNSASTLILHNLQYFRETTQGILISLKWLKLAVWSRFTSLNHYSTNWYICVIKSVSASLQQHQGQSSFKS